eukprot:CAMPEP_0174925786 /NCGR_PEP_ID=MMETSP1355-20121228/8144_1 /TAXON_ID=464990 /ORGANISM="Hemiselmis tepida, Strain CCMP443" /LENGTH=76 /DNA_ID=CAMNT_0016171741 /DNA_START=216 /DNA_END=446 /DNA_ORIENTATION=+
MSGSVKAGNGAAAAAAARPPETAIGSAVPWERFLAASKRPHQAAAPCMACAFACCLFRLFLSLSSSCLVRDLRPVS